MNEALRPIPFAAADAPARLTQDLRELGFAVLAGAPLDHAAIDRIYDAWLAFFQSEEKHGFRYDKVRQDGFFSTEEAEHAKGQALRDLKEYFHYYPWGRCPDALKADLEAYYAAVLALGQTLLKWVEAEAPAAATVALHEPLSSMIAGSDVSLLRILHYPPLDETAREGVRAAAHADINLLTILPAASAPGLEVKSREGRWLTVPCTPGLVVVNTGDMLQEATGGYFPSTIHRVVNPEGSAARGRRLSLPLFLHPRPEVILSARHSAGSYLQQRLEELGVV